MRDEIRNQLLAINREFYHEFAESFAATRANPQPGFQCLLPHIPPSARRALDVGCGEGRFGRFLSAARPDIHYVGVDLSETLIAYARASVDGAWFEQRDVSQPNCLTGLGRFDIVVCLAVLQHIPGHAQRVRLLHEMAGRLERNGRLLISTWQFLESERQRRKIVPWSAANLTQQAVENGDYLLSWRSGGYGLRYVALVDRREMGRLATEAGLQIVDSFRSDGLEGDLNLYTILAPQVEPGALS